MKTKTGNLAILLALIMTSCAFTRQAPVQQPYISSSVQQPYISFQVFYDQLSPYGQWVDYQNYGYAWIPDAGPDFVPYSTGGHWIMTEYGWTWASDYDWGWAPFHYGRWDYDNYYGWLWIPDNEWGPAWVTWRRAEGYYGWAPMGPGVSITMSFGNNYNNYNNHWTFVNDRYFGKNDMYQNYANQNDYDRIFRNSNVINNTYVDNRYQTTYVSGPDRSEVQQVTGRRVNSYALKENSVPGQDLRNSQYRTYRPQIVKTNDNEPRPSPTRITNLQDVRRPSERNTYNQQNDNRRSVQQQNAVNQQNVVNQQNAVNNNREQLQNNLDRKNAAEKQNAVDQQNALERKNAADKQSAVDQQNALNRQNAVDQQNAINRQNAADKQNATDKPNAVDQQNAEIRQNAMDKRNAADKQKAVDHQNAADKQNAVNRQNAGNKQNITDRQAPVNQRNVRNNKKAVQHPDAKKTRKSEPPKKSNSEANNR